MSKKKAISNPLDEGTCEAKSRSVRRSSPSTSTTPDSESVLKGLSNAWKQWCAMMKKSGVWDGSANPEDWECIGLRLQKFHPPTHLPHEEIHAAAMALSKGKALVEAALKWDNPIIGAGMTVTDVVRGEQWRFVMAWGGLETIVKTLLRLPKRNGIKDDQMRSFVDSCDLPTYVPIASPNKSLKDLEDWLAKGEKNGKYEMLVFLGVDAGDATAIREWLIEGHGIESWPSAMKLSKAIRNATGHGALLPAKVSGWGLRKVIQRLTLDLGQLVAGAIEQLAKID